MRKDDHNVGGMWAFSFAMIFNVMFFVYISFFHPGVSFSGDKKVAAAAAPKQEAGNPSDAWVSSPEKIKLGEEKYKVACGICHGNTGLGDGVAGASLNPKPRNLVEGQWKVGGSPFVLFNTITKGLAGTSMAPFGHIPENERWAMVHFVRSITKNAPAATAAEIAAFKKGGK